MFVIHAILLVILTIIAGIAMVAFTIAFYSDTYTTASGLIRSHSKWLSAAILCFFIFVGGMTWWIKSANEPWKPELETTHEIKEVIFPDGTKQQMFTCDGVHYNITVLFGKIVEPKDWTVKRIRWNPYYLGVSYSSCQRCFRDEFVLTRVDETASHKLIEPVQENKK